MLSPLNTCVLFSHDYAEDLGTVSSELAQLRETLHSHVLAYDYAGYGPSKEHRATEQTCVADIQACLAWLGSTKGIPPSKIILYAT
jgi:hypothetical protein